MDFFALILFLALYYVRPQEWTPFFDTLHPIQLLSILALWAMIQTGKLRPRDLVRTPLDWLVLLYFIWTLIAGFQFRRSLGEIQAVLLFYFVAVRSLDSISRQKRFLAWWCFFIVLISGLAIASLYGIDPLNSNELTQGPMKGRLVLNLSIFNNPNALAHSVIPAVPLIYYLFVWRRVAAKAVFVTMAIPVYCILLTQSKGAFLSGFATLLATLTFGRSKIWQVLVLVMAIAFGYGALYSLPRMNELRNSKSDPAIQGRIAAFSYGLHLMRSYSFGIGLGNFEESFLRDGPMEKHVVVRNASTGNGNPNRDTDEEAAPAQHRIDIWAHYVKATHSAYNQNGAELGYTGLFLFVGLLYCCVRTLLLMKCETTDEERIRRALFALVVAYAVSSWMVDFGYRPTFFLFIAAISGLHRHFLKKQDESEQPAGTELVPKLPPWLRRPRTVQMPGLSMPGLAGLPMPGVAASGIGAQTLAATPIPGTVYARLPGSGRILPWHAQPEPRNPLRPKFLWTRLGITDFLIILALTYVAIRYWQHIIATM
jgi:hypothetical protein